MINGVQIVCLIVAFGFFAWAIWSFVRVLVARHKAKKEKAKENDSKKVDTLEGGIDKE